MSEASCQCEVGELAGGVRKTASKYGFADTPAAAGIHRRGGVRNILQQGMHELTSPAKSLVSSKLPTAEIAGARPAHCSLLVEERRRRLVGSDQVGGEQQDGWRKGQW